MSVNKSVIRQYQWLALVGRPCGKFLPHTWFFVHPVAAEKDRDLCFGDFSCRSFLHNLPYSAFTYVRPIFVSVTSKCRHRSGKTAEI